MSFGLTELPESYQIYVPGFCHQTFSCLPRVHLRLQQAQQTMQENQLYKENKSISCKRTKSTESINQDTHFRDTPLVSSLKPNRHLNYHQRPKCKYHLANTIASIVSLSCLLRYPSSVLMLLVTFQSNKTSMFLVYHDLGLPCKVK